MLSLMTGCSAEDFQMHWGQYSGSKEIKLESDVLLDNVRSVLKQIKVRQFFLLLNYICLSMNKFCLFQLSLNLNNMYCFFTEIQKIR